MKDRGHSTAFYIETLVMIMIFVVIILVLTKVFAIAKADSINAKELTNAVAMAQNTAEVIQSSESKDEFITLMDEDGNVTEDGDTVVIRYDKDNKADSQGIYAVNVTWTPKKTDAGELVTSDISVIYGDDEDSIYDMSTKVYIKEGKR